LYVRTFGNTNVGSHNQTLKFSTLYDLKLAFFDLKSVKQYLNNTKQKLIKKIFNKIGWTGAIIIMASIGIFIYGTVKHNTLIENAVYIQGTSLGINEGVRGSLYLYYSFNVGDTEYKGHVTTDFCKICNKCCEKGNTVIVRFQRNNAENNDLVPELPNGASFENSP